MAYYYSAHHHRHRHNGMNVDKGYVIKDLCLFYSSQ